MNPRMQAEAKEEARDEGEVNTRKALIALNRVVSAPFLSFRMARPILKR